MRSTILFFILSLMNGMLFAQNIDTHNGKILNRQQALADYNILYETLINYHPNPFAYISKDDFKNFFESQKINLPDTINELTFHLFCRQLITQIKCGHTFAKPSEEWYASVDGKNVQLPFDVKNIDGKLYINNTIGEKFDFATNDELLSINGLEAKDLLSTMTSIQERDGHTTSYVNALIEKRFRTYILFILGIQNEYTVEFKSQSGEVKRTTIQPTNKKLIEVNNQELPSDFKKIMSNNWSVFSYDSIANIAYLKINNFSDRKEFKEYYKSVFQYLHGIPNSKLLLDIRDNPGGYFGNGNNFLTYLTPNKFELTFQKPHNKKVKNEYIGLNKWSKWTKIAFSLKPAKYKIEGHTTETFIYKPSKYNFEGKVFVVINGVTFSQAALVAAQLREYGAFFLGQETGGAEIGCNGILSYKLVLPNSGMVVAIPVYHIKSNSSKGAFGFGVKPNFFTQPKLDNSRDYTLEEAIEAVKADKQNEE